MRGEGIGNEGRKKRKKKKTHTQTKHTHKKKGQNTNKKRHQPPVLFPDLGELRPANWKQKWTQILFSRSLTTECKQGDVVADGSPRRTVREA